MTTPAILRCSTPGCTTIVEARTIELALAAARRYGWHGVYQRLPICAECHRKTIVVTTRRAVDFLRAQVEAKTLPPHHQSTAEEMLREWER